MPQEIYNEGRVVGLSAWELYKRQALSNGVPEEEIPDEREWLASMIGSGASMVLKITGTNNGYAAGVHDYALPANSELTSAGVIVATPFIGECEFESNNVSSALWAKKITSYGSLIENDTTKSPTSSNVPYADTPSDYKDNVSEFLKITDGIVFTKNAKWLNRFEHRRENFSGNGTTTAFELTTTETVLRITEVTISNLPVSPSSYSFASNTITFTTAPEDDAPIAIYYDVINNAPVKDMDPNFNSSSTVVRLYFNSALKHDVYVLLTGFANKRVLQGLSGYTHESTTYVGYATGGPTDSDANDWINGGLLGPEIVPWASKIIFTVPTSSYNLVNALSRTIPSDQTYTIPQGGLDFAGIKIYENAIDSAVKSSSIIDFSSINLTDYYDRHSTSNTLLENVSEVSFGMNDSASNLVAWYPGMSASQINTEIGRAEPSNANFFPPALYAAKVTKSGPTTLVPLDTAAPGTVKVFKSAKEASDYKTLMPDNYAMYYNQHRLSYSYAIPNVDSNYWPGSAQLHYDDVPTVSLIAGGEETKLISLMSPEHVPYATTGVAGTIPIGPTGNPTWQNLLQALPNNYALDVLGPALHTVGGELESNGTIGHSDTISDIKATSFTVAGSYPISITTSQNSDDNTTNLATLQANQAYKSGTDFIEFSNGLRLYISNTAPDPTNVPVGSIGIGWVGDSVVDEIISENPPIEESDSRPAMGG